MKILIILGSLYLLILIATILNTLLITPNENISIFSGPMIFMYSLFVVFIIFVFYNIKRYHSDIMLRKKAIKDYDERNYAIQERTNTYTLGITFFILFIGCILGISLNSMELFIICFLLIILLLVVHFVIKIILKRKM